MYNSCDKCNGKGLIYLGWLKWKDCCACDGSGRMKIPPRNMLRPASPPPPPMKEKTIRVIIERR